MLLGLVLAFTILRPPPTPGPYERDFEAYYAAGVTVNANRDPYSRAIWNAEKVIPGVDAGRDELLPFVGPAASLPLWSILARAPYGAALRIWTALLALAFLILLASALRLAKAPREPLLLLTAAVFAFVSAPMISSIALGQVALLSAAALGVALLFYPARNALGAGLATLLAALQPNLALALIARIRSRWDFAVATAAAAVFVLFTVAAGHGIAGIIAYAHRLSAHAGAERFITIQHTLPAIVYAFGADPAVAIATGTAVAVIAILTTAAIIFFGRLDPGTAALFALTMLPLAIPFFHEHDFVVELLPAIVLAICARGKTRAAAAVAVALVLVDWFGLAQRGDAQVQILALGFAAVCGFVALGPRNEKDQRYGLTGLLALVVLSNIAVPLAHNHPAPTWPDTLPAAFHASPTADASGVWGDEQRSAGLDARDPAWSILRLFPLAGCLLFAVAIIAEGRRRQRERWLPETPPRTTGGV
jgi:hypothetical protein